jgi:hypothetical protein
VICFPYSAWQIAVTLTFCHTVIDLSQDIYPDTSTQSLMAARVALVLIVTFVVFAFTAWFRRRKNMVQKMFLLLVWSTVFVAFLRFVNQPEIFNISELSFRELIMERFFVHIVFLTSAVIVSGLSFYKTKGY